MKNFEVDDEKKWDYLEHHGVTFPDPYIPKNIKVLYDGEQVRYIIIIMQLKCL